MPAIAPVRCARPRNCFPTHGAEELDEVAARMASPLMARCVAVQEELCGEAYPFLAVAPVETTRVAYIAIVASFVFHKTAGPITSIMHRAFLEIAPPRGISQVDTFLAKAEIQEAGFIL